MWFWQCTLFFFFLRLISFSCISPNFDRVVQEFSATASSGPVETSQKAPCHGGCRFHVLLLVLAPLQCCRSPLPKPVPKQEGCYHQQHLPPPMGRLKATSALYNTESLVLPNQVSFCVQNRWSSSACAPTPACAVLPSARAWVTQAAQTCRECPG